MAMARAADLWEIHGFCRDITSENQKHSQSYVNSVVCYVRPQSLGSELSGLSTDLAVKINGSKKGSIHMYRGN